MSFEGEYQWLCENGHLTGHCVYNEKPKSCRFCGAKLVWYHILDQTNGYRKRNDAMHFLKKIKKGATTKCECCGQTSREPDVYEIPKDEG